MKDEQQEDWQHLLATLEVFFGKRIEEVYNRQESALVNVDNLPTSFISKLTGFNLTFAEELIIALALLSDIKPAFFDNIIARLFPNGADLPELGGVKGTNHRGVIPTGETFLFLWSGQNLSLRLEAMNFFRAEGILAAQNIAWLEPVKEGEPLFSGKIILNKEIKDKILTGGVQRPKFGPDFPAKIITTQLGWNDLIINPTTMHEIETIRNWIQHSEEMVKAWGFKKMFKPGYRVLFYGPPGTGKTFTATLLGKHFNRDVYRIDLAQVVSKFIGETEKNLETIFRKAEDKNWILFFDEADALFGKRTAISNAHDRYANQETSYLLQRVEEFNGLVILASNDKGNIDSAFLRRFNAIVHFPAPDYEERARLWNIYLPEGHGVEPENLVNISRKYEVSGSTIVNSIQHAALVAYSSNRKIVNNDLLNSLRRELRKEDRMLN